MWAIWFLVIACSWGIGFVIGAEAARWEYEREKRESGKKE